MQYMLNAFWSTGELYSGIVYDAVHQVTMMIEVSDQVFCNVRVIFCEHELQHLQQPITPRSGAGYPYHGVRAIVLHGHACGGRAYTSIQRIVFTISMAALQAQERPPTEWAGMRPAVNAGAAVVAAFTLQELNGGVGISLIRDGSHQLLARHLKKSHRNDLPVGDSSRLAWLSGLLNM
jgi:hypothetical protein